ncbi:hypothetical protein NCS55_01489300 [Fusarium keratoplasticum]|nr:hypothetical protein NCS55_01489300 [Fusarium keratoplasticum]
MTAIHKNYKFGKECNTTAILFFYNKIHNFWDGSVYNPDGEPLPEANAIIRDILKRQVVSESDGELVRHTAKEREADGQAKALQSAKADNGAQPAAQKATCGCPASITRLPQPSRRSQLREATSPTVGPLDNCDDNEHDEPEYDGVDEEIAPTGLAVSAADDDQDVFRRQQEPRTSPPAVDHDAEGEPYEAADSGAAFTHDGAGESIHFEEPQEQPAPYEFIAMMAGDDAWMNMDMPMAGFQGTADFGVDGLSDLNLDIDMAMDMLSNADELQGPRAAIVRRRPRRACLRPAPLRRLHLPHEAAGGNRQTRSATTTDESAPQPAPRTGLVGYAQSQQRDDDQSITTSANRLCTTTKPARHHDPSAVPLYTGREAGTWAPTKILAG